MTFLWSLAAFQGSPSAGSLILEPPPCGPARHGLRILRRPGSLHRPWHSPYAVFLHPTLQAIFSENYLTYFLHIRQTNSKDKLLAFYFYQLRQIVLESRYS